MKRLIALLIVLLGTNAITTYGAISHEEKQPPQERSLLQNEPLGPKVIINNHPVQNDKVDATQVQEHDPYAGEPVDRDTLLKTTVSPTTHSNFKVKPTRGRKTMALALGGGGARGAAHIGVLRVLEQEGIPIDYIVGNSMGAVVGGLYSAGISLDRLEQLGVSGGLRKYYLPGMIRRLLLMPISKLMQPICKEKLAGLISGNRLEKYLDTLIPPDRTNIEALRIPFSAVATNLLDGKAYRISTGKLAKAIRASACMAPLLRPVKIDDKIFVDGGVRSNLPASSARDTDADIVIAVMVDAPLTELPAATFYKYKGITSRLADIILAVTDEHQLQFADVVLSPDISGIPMLSDHPALVRKAIRAGEEAARIAVPTIRRKMGLPDRRQLVESASPAQQ